MRRESIPNLSTLGSTTGLCQSSHRALFRILPLSFPIGHVQGIITIYLHDVSHLDSLIQITLLENELQVSEDRSGFDTYRTPFLKKLNLPNSSIKGGEVRTWVKVLLGTSKETR